MKRSVFVLGTAGLLVPNVAEAALVGTRRALVSTGQSMAVVDHANAGSGASASLAVNWASGRAPGVGKLMIAVMQGSGANTFTNSNSWTFLNNPGNVGANGSIPFALAYKFSTSSDTSSMTWGLSTTSANINVCCIQIVGAANQVPLWVQTTATTSPVTCGPLTTSSPKNLAILGVGTQSTTSSIPAPAGYTQQAYIATAYGSAIHVSNGYVSGNISQTATATWSSGGTRINGYMILVAAA